MQPQLQFSVPCLEVESSASGIPSFHCIIFELGIKKDFPYKFDCFYIANGWHSGIGQHTQTVKILSPDGKTLLDSGEQPLDFASPTSPCLVANRIESLVLPTPGLYRVQTFLNNDLVMDYPIRFYKAQAEN